MACAIPLAGWLEEHCLEAELQAEFHHTAARGVERRAGRVFVGVGHA